MQSPARKRLTSTRRWLWVWVLLWVVVLLFANFYGVTASEYKYTYLEPAASPGTLHTQRWSYGFFFTGSFALLWLVPLTMAYMSDAPHKGGRQTLHAVLTILMLMYWVAIMITWSLDLGNANKVSAANGANEANDPRWCCLYFNLVGAGCPNTAACTPGVGAGDLIVNPLFVFKYAFTWIAVAMLAIDFLVTVCVFRARVSDFMDSLPRVTGTSEDNDVENGSSAPSAPPEYDMPPVDGGGGGGGGVVVVANQKQTMAATSELRSPLRGSIYYASAKKALRK
jgi:hypothetical protein